MFMTGRLCGRGLGGGGTQHDASLASVFASTSSADACQGRLEIVLDYFQSCQSDEWWEQLNISHVCQVELSPRISSIYENVRNFTVFEKKNRSITSPSAKFCQFVSQLIKSREIVMPPSLFDRLPDELITKILDMIFEESDDYPEGAHYFLEYQIFKRDPENYHGCFEIEFLV